MQELLGRSFFVLAFACVTCATACSGGSQGVDRVERVGRVSAAIVDGTPSDASQDAVVRLVVVDPTNSAKDTVCTGTLVASDIVLTARHCVSRAQESVTCLVVDGALVGGDIFEDHDPANIQVVTGLMPSATQTDAVGAKIFHDSGTNLCGHDLALLILDRRLATPIAPIRLATSVMVNDRFTAVGWGTNGASVLPATRQQRAGVLVEDLGPTQVDLSTGHRVAIGDNEILAGEADCSGDSGGPALDVTTGAVIGVATRSGVGAPDTASPCRNSKNVYALPSGFKDVIDAAFSAAGEQVWSEGQPEPPRPPPTPVASPSKSGCAVGIAAGDRTSFASLAACMLAAIAVAAARRLRSASRRSRATPRPCPDRIRDRAANPSR